MDKYIVSGPKDYRLIPQRGVRQYVYPERFSHNAIWDSNAGPDGKLYYALATEIATSGYVRLCSYDYHTNEVREHFKIEDVILPQDRAIRASKFHSSICFLPDGRMIMTTHTTDRSPRHPTWMPLAYYHHLWEGFAGGQIILYDPRTGKAENLGTPVPHESIYGARYDPAHNALFFTGFMRGHLYRYSLDDRRVMDFGKVSENNAFRLALGPDGNLYGASRTGYLYRVDTDTLELTDLNFQLPHEPYDHTTRYNNLSIARTGPDGRLYMAVMYGRSILALDTATGRIEDMGPYLPAERYSPAENRNGVFGMDFDSRGVLWYVVTSLNNYETTREYGIPSGLFRWDLTRGGRPEFMGVAGTPQRACAWNSEVVCTADDILYITGSNHSLDGPDLLGIDLKVFDPAKACTGGMVEDEYFDPACPRYIQSAEEIFAQEQLLEQNPTDVALPLAADPVLLWRALAPDRIESSAVSHLFWKGDTLCGVCGGGENEKYAFEIQGGVLTSLRRFSDLSAEEVAAFESNSGRPDPARFTDLPYVPGRQYKAVPTAAARLADGRELVGTLDGLLALVGPDGSYALGAPAANGPIHALSATPDGTTVYGVAGDEDDIATLFRYQAASGLRALGYMSRGVTPRIEQVHCCTYVTSCAVSPDGRFLAVGANERLGTVLLYAL